MKAGQKETLAGYSFMLPGILGFLFFMLIPILFSFYISFCKWDLLSGYKGIEWIGLDNFANIFKDTIFKNSLMNNIKYTMIVVPVNILLSLIIAVLLNEMVYFKSILRTMFFIPYVSNIVAVAAVWMALFSPMGGPVNKMLTAFGVQNLPGWLTSKEWALYTIMMMSIWMGIGYCVVIYIAALQNIPEELVEACSIDGCGRIKRFFRITIPMLSETTFFLVVTRIILSFQVFAPVNIMTEGGPGNSTTVLVFQIYKECFRFYKIGYASSIAWILFAIIFIITLFQWKMQKRLDN